MDVKRILSEIDAEIAHLQQIRSALAGYSGDVAEKPRRGRPKGSKNVATAPAKRTRKLTAEGRKKIADAMKRRWAERRKETAK